MGNPILNGYVLRIRLSSCNATALIGLLAGGATAATITTWILGKIPTIPTAALAVLAQLVAWMAAGAAAAVGVCNSRGTGINIYSLSPTVNWCTWR